MSKERELLREIMGYIASGVVSITSNDLGDAAETLHEIQELLAQPETKQEPVAWMWTRNYEGGGYTNKVFEFLNDAEEYAKDSKTLKSPDIIRPLYTAPPTHLISAAPELLEALSNWINALDDPSEWMKCRDDAKKAIEKAHGITGVDYE